MAVGRFCTTLTHMIAAEHAGSCLFALYTENKDSTQRYCSIKFMEKHLPYIKPLTDSQWYIATRDRLELAVTCPCKLQTKHLPYIKPLTDSQWYIATRDRLKLAVTCPHSYRQIISPPFSIYSLQESCIGFSARVKLFAPIIDFD